MKKIKFLNGVSAFALAAVALAATFTSCEKEEFNVDVTPVNATATVSPIVLAIEDGITKDVTADAATTITCTPSATFTGNPNLAETSVSVKAVYKDIETTVTVKVPALTAGQSVVLTPTIVLSKEYTIIAETTDVATDPDVEVKNVDNYNMYWYSDYPITYTDKKGILVDKESKMINTTNLEEVAAINSFFAGLDETYVANQDAKKEVTVYANSRTIVDITYTIATKKYSIVKKAVTKADAEPLATILTKDYTTTVDASKVDQDIPGHGHSHGHGHGHGDSNNAGGGIVVVD